MADDPHESGPEYSSRSEINRFLLALSFAAFALAGIAHAASYWGIVLVHNRDLQALLTWVLVALMLWKVLGSPSMNISGRLTGVITAAWVYAIALVEFSPGPGQRCLWPLMARWLGLYGADPLLVHARTSSAVQVAVSLSLFVSLWFRPNSPRVYPGTFSKLGLMLSQRVGRSVAFGIVLPGGVIVACGLLWRMKWGNVGLIEWIGIIAVFWWIAGMIVMGVCIVRDAMRRDA